MNEQSIEILLFGDSITLGAAVVQNSDILTTVERAYPDILARELPECRITRDAKVHRTTAKALNDLPTALAIHRPHIVVLMLGGNDADMNWRRFLITRGASAQSKVRPEEFGRNIIRLATIVQTAGAIPILTDIPDHDLGVRGQALSQLAGMDVNLFLSASNVQQKSDASLHEYRRHIRSAAAHHHTLLAEFGDQLALLGRENVIGPDGVHPNAAGHMVIAQSLLSILRPLADSLRGRLVHYAS